MLHFQMITSSLCDLNTKVLIEQNPINCTWYVEFFQICDGPTSLDMIFITQKKIVSLENKSDVNQQHSIIAEPYCY